jgi:hypothetical protein
MRAAIERAGASPRAAHDGRLEGACTDLFTAIV